MDSTSRSSHLTPFRLTPLSMARPPCLTKSFLIQVFFHLVQSPPFQLLSFAAWRNPPPTSVYRSEGPGPRLPKKFPPCCHAPTSHLRGSHEPCTRDPLPSPVEKDAVKGWPEPSLGRLHSAGWEGALSSLLTEFWMHKPIFPCACLAPRQQALWWAEPAALCVPS